MPELILDRLIHGEWRCTMPRPDKPHCKECGSPLAQEAGIESIEPGHPDYTFSICTNVDCIDSWV
jgi:hypothetical protein